MKLVFNSFDNDFLLETMSLWQPHYEEELTTEDAREIATNMVEFFNILVEWDEGRVYFTL